MPPAYSIRTLIITPVEIEYTAVCKHFSVRQVADKKLRNVYAEGSYATKNVNYQIRVTRPGSGVDVIAAELGMLVQSFEPDLVILTGIARGVKDVKLGDVVIGSQGHNYESGVQTNEGFSARPRDVISTHDLVEIASNITKNRDWQNNIQWLAPAPVNQQKIRVYTGAIASGNRVIKGDNNSVIKQIKKHYNATLALEMEAGALRLLHKFPHIKHINIRAISDVAEHDKAQTDKAGYRTAAAAIAAGFTFSLLHDIPWTFSDKPIAHEPQIKMVHSPSLDQLGDHVKEALFHGNVQQMVSKLGEIEKELGDKYHIEVRVLAGNWRQYQQEQIQGIMDAGSARQTYNQLSVQTLQFLELILH